jgi:hypothetical protein
LERFLAVRNRRAPVVFRALAVSIPIPELVPVMRMVLSPSLPVLVSRTLPRSLEEGFVKLTLEMIVFHDLEGSWAGVSGSFGLFMGAHVTGKLWRIVLCHVKSWERHRCSREGHFSGIDQDGIMLLLEM